MAAPPPQTGATLGGAAPPPALPAPATPHSFNRVVVPGADNSLDYVAVRADATVIKGLPSLGWINSSSVQPNTRAVPVLTLAGAICLPTFFEDLSLGWAGTMLCLQEITMVPSMALLNRCADACDSLKLFAVPISTESDWSAKLESALPRAGSPSPFALRAGELMEANAFEVAGVAAVPAVPGRARVPAVRAVRSRGIAGVAAIPAVPAVAAIPGVPGRKPPALVWWSLLLVQDSMDGQSVFPLRAIWRRGLAAPDRVHIVARDDPMSRVQALANTLSKHLASMANNPSATDVELARTMRMEGERLLTLPDALRSGSFDSGVLLLEASHDLTYSKKVSQQDGVTVARVLLAKRTYPDAVGYLSQLSSIPARRDAIIDLTAALPAHFANAPLFARLEPLDSFLKLHSAFIVQSANASIPLDGPMGITSLLLKEHEEWKQTPSGRGPSPSEKDADDVLVTDSAWKRALVEHRPFLQASQEIIAEDLDAVQGRENAVETACLSGCVVFQRYFAYPQQMMSRAPVFATLHKCWAARRSYLSKAQAANSAGKVPKLQQNWLITEESAVHIFGGKLTKWHFFNGDSGALALYNLSVSEPFEPCPADQLYVVTSVLEKIIPFVKASFGAVGWASSSSTGYTLHDLFQRQLDHVRMVQGMGDVEQATLLAKAQVRFTQALLDAELHISNLLRDPEPVSVVLDHVLPFGGAFDKELAEVEDSAEPLIQIRRVFHGSSLLPTSAPRSLPGVVLSAPAGGGAGPSGTPPGGVKGGGKPGGPKGGGKPSGKNAPGSLKSVATWTDDTHVTLGTLSYDVPALCDYYKLDGKDFCVSNLSVKKGPDKLALCAHFGQPGHEGPNSSAHTVPKHFNLAYVNKHFAKPVEKQSDKSAGKKRKAGT